MGSVLGKVPVVGELLAGKQDPGTQGQVVNTLSPEAIAASRQLMGQYQQLAGQDTSALAATQTANLAAQARQSAKDQEMLTKQMVAQRGLGKSASGINAILGTQQNLGRELGAIQANQPLLANQLQLQNLQMAGQGISGLMGAQNQGQLYQQAQASRGRQGGLLGVTGATLGGILGSAGGPLGTAIGAQAGLGIGQALTQM